MQKGNKMTKSCDEKIIDLEILMTEYQRIIDDMNDEIIRQGKIIARLEKEVTALKQEIVENNVKPLSEETPPPHY